MTDNTPQLRINVFHFLLSLSRRKEESVSLGIGVIAAMTRFSSLANSVVHSHREGRLDQTPLP